MPSRVIRGKINSSASLSRVSIGAELTFCRLITAVDDYGRFDARPDMLKAALFPVRADAPPYRVMEWIRELAAEGCVQLFEVDDQPYLAMPGWEKHRGNQKRRKVSEYPDPPPIGSSASKPPPRISENPQDVTPGLGLGLGLGLGDGLGGGVGVEPAASPPPPPPDSPKKQAQPRAQKRKTSCPEKLSLEQWNRVFAWRTREHNEKFSNAELVAQWKLCRDHHIGKGNLWVDWVRAFYSWLAGPYYKPAVSGGKQAARPTPRYVEAERRPAPKPPTEGEMTTLGEELDAIREGTRLGPRAGARS